MNRKTITLISILATLVILLSACGAAETTPDAAAISTAAAQTVEARFTQQAAAFTQTPAAPTLTAPPLSTATQGFPPTQTTEPGLPTPTSNGKACYQMTFLEDVTIPDGMIIVPGAKFTKTWRVRNDGNCPWDQKYALELSQGDAMGTLAKIPLTQVIAPGDTADLTVELTAPTTEGVYAGYWHLATPYGGYIGVGAYNQALFVKIHATVNPDNSFGAANVTYDYTRQPQKGCSADGAYYTFTATITANAPGTIKYRWDKNPDDGQPEGGTIKFAAAGSKTVSWIWHMTRDHVQGIDRWVSITTIVGSQETKFGKVTFNFTCNP